MKIKCILTNSKDDSTGEPSPMFCELKCLKKLLLLRKTDTGEKTI